MKTLVSANQALINQSKPGNEKEPTNIQRRALSTALLGAGLGSGKRIADKGCCIKPNRQGHPRRPTAMLCHRGRAEIRGAT
jgi:hypothetical protein